MAMKKVYKMKQYSVTLNFTFTPHGCDVMEEYDDEGDPLPMEGEEKQKYDAYQRTDDFFEKNDIVKYIKQNDAFGFVDNILCDGEVVSAHWFKEKFAIEMIVDTKQTAEELEEDLRSNSLEDGEYEACGETGWLVFTRGKNGEAVGHDGKWDMTDFWEYGLTDYRDNPIEIKQISEKPEMPPTDELFTVTEKGKQIHKQLGELKWKGLKLSQEDEKKFQILCLALKDPRMYPV
jgi:hypothetical protein